MSLVPKLPGRRLTLLRMDAEILAAIFRGHPYRRLESDWPDDAKITSARWDMDRQVVYLCVESSTFAEVPIGMTIPEWTPTFTTHDLAPELLDLMTSHESATRA